MKKSDFYIENFKNIQEMIKFMDQKANILLVVYGFVIATYFKIIENLDFVNIFTGETLENKISEFVIFFLSFFLVILIIAQVYLLIFKILRPRKAKHYSNVKKSLFYFEHIKGQEKGEFIEKIKNLTNEECDQEIIEQIYEVAKIATKKQKYYQILAKLLFLTFVLLIIFTCIMKL